MHILPRIANICTGVIENHRLKDEKSLYLVRNKNAAWTGKSRTVSGRLRIRWADDSLGSTDSTIGGEGCAVSSAAMVLAYYGVNVDPGILNTFLTNNEGYTPQGWLYWEKAAAFAPGKAKHVYEDAPSYYLIDSNLLRGNPVIIRIRLRSGITHFVVIVGKRGFHYLIQDPASSGDTGIYPLYRLVAKIEALRFYEKLGD